MRRRKLLEESLTGRNFVNKYGDTVVVVKIHNAKSVLVEFEDGFRKSLQKNALLKGTFKSPYSRTLYGVGYLVGVWWISLIILFCTSFVIYWCTEQVKLFK